MLNWLIVLSRSLALLYSAFQVNSWRSHGLRQSKLLWFSLSPGVCSNSCPLSWWCHPFISFSNALFSFCPQSFLSSGFFPMSWFFVSGVQSIRASAPIPPMNIQGWFPLRLTVQGPSRVFSNTTVQKYQAFSAQPSLWFNSYICT